MDLRRPLIAGNWKMFKTGPEAVETADRLAKLLSTPLDVDVMIAPPFTALALVSDMLKNTRISLGAQNLFWEEEGAYTGEISTSMLVSPVAGTLSSAIRNGVKILAKPTTPSTRK